MKRIATDIQSDFTEFILTQQPVPRQKFILY